LALRWIGQCGNQPHFGLPPLGALVLSLIDGFMVPFRVDFYLRRLVVTVVRNLHWLRLPGLWLPRKGSLLDLFWYALVIWRILICMLVAHGRFGTYPGCDLPLALGTTELMLVLALFSPALRLTWYDANDPISTFNGTAIWWSQAPYWSCCSPWPWSWSGGYWVRVDLYVVKSTFIVLVIVTSFPSLFFSFWFWYWVYWCSSYRRHTHTTRYVTLSNLSQIAQRVAQPEIMVLTVWMAHCLDIIPTGTYCCYYRRSRYIEGVCLCAMLSFRRGRV
jgi:hypothetical protein